MSGGNGPGHRSNRGVHATRERAACRWPVAGGCELDEAGFPRVGATGLTSVSGVWAAGNVVDPCAQVITSAGAGSAATIAINADLVREDVRRAVRVPY